MISVLFFDLDVFAVVSWDWDNAAYKLQVFSEESVPLFGPPLPIPAIFEDPQEFREFLIVKCEYGVTTILCLKITGDHPVLIGINGEKAAFNTPIFAQKRERTLDSLLRDLYTEHVQGEYSKVRTSLLGAG